jgi:hypothetical protein
MEAHITLEVRSDDRARLVEKIGALFDVFEDRDAIRKSGALNSEQLEATRKLVQSFGAVLSGMEYAEFSDGKASAGFIGGWESEDFAAKLARNIFLLGFDDFEIVVIEDETTYVVGVLQMAIVCEYFEYLDDYQESGFQFPQVINFD